MDKCIQKATLAMGESIRNLINTYARIEDTGVLPRSLKNIYESIREFTVCIENNKVIGCVCMHIFSSDVRKKSVESLKEEVKELGIPKLFTLTKVVGEIRSLVVDFDNKEKGIGKKLVEALESEAKDLGIQKLFTLTKATEFFEKLGYNIIEHDEIPRAFIHAECLNCNKYPCDEIALTKIL